jgi:hypothetical protein
MVAFRAIPAAAQNADNWLDDTGNWDTAADWSNGVPGGNGNVNVNITDSDGVSRTVTYDSASPPATVHLLTVSLSGGTAGAADTLSISNNSLSANWEVVGNAGQGIIDQQSGTNDPGILQVGYGANSSGEYVLAGTLTNTFGEDIGADGGTATFTQTGGTNNADYSDFEGAGIRVGNGGTGTYTLSGNGILNVFSVEEIGFGGTGSFIQTGGSNTLYTADIPDQDASLIVDGPNGYNLSGNSMLSVTGEFGAESVGYLGEGTFTQTGGTNFISESDGGLYVGGADGPFSSTGTGTYYLSGGLLSVGTDGYTGEIVGASGTGSFVQTAGTNTPGYLDVGLGYGHKGIGNYQLTGGSLSVASIELIPDGDSTGSFIQTGGTNSSASLSVGQGGNGTYQLQGGSLTVLGNEYLGFSGGSSLSACVADFFQTGGCNTIASGGNLDIEASTGTSSAIYTLSQGALTISGQMDILNRSGGPNSLVQTGGVLDVAGQIEINGYNSTLSIGAGSATAGSLIAQGILSFGIHNTTDFGQIQVIGGVTVGNALNLQIDPTYTPQLGDTFPIIVSQSGTNVIGQFATITGNFPASGGEFTVEYDPPDNPYGVDVVFIPEPGAPTLLLTIAAGGLLLRRNRKTC